MIQPSYAFSFAAVTSLVALVVFVVMRVGDVENVGER
jgi:hypothetical protein